MTPMIPSEQEASAGKSIPGGTAMEMMPDESSHERVLEAKAFPGSDST